MPAVITREQLTETVCRFAAEQASVNPAEVSVDMHFVNDLNFDSLDKVEFVMTLEDEFGVDIPDDEAMKAQFVRDAVELLCGYLSLT